MFPKGKFDDQVDSTSQALEFVGMPGPYDGFYKYIRLSILRDYGLTPEDITVTFDHIEHTTEFHVSSGRTLLREGDGFYHCTRIEWGGLQNLQGVTLIEDRSP